MIRLSDRLAEILINDEIGPCYEIIYFPNPNSLIATDPAKYYVLIKEVPCNTNVPNIPCPTCWPYLYLNVVLNYNFVDLFPGNTLEEKRSKAESAAINVIGDGLGIWHSRTYDLHCPNDIASDIRNFYYIEKDKPFSIPTNKCARSDLNIFFTSTSNGYQGVFKSSLNQPCTNPQYFNFSKGTIEIQYNKNFQNEITFAHELGHFFCASHTEDCNPAIDCFAAPYLMCKNGPATNDPSKVEWDDCTWQQIVVCQEKECLCSEFQFPECEHCEFESLISGTKDYLVPDCTSNNETEIEIRLINDCFEKNDSYIFSYFNGNNTNDPKFEVLNRGLFVNNHSTDSRFNYISTNPIHLEPEEELIIKLKFRLVRTGSNDNECITPSNGDFRLYKNNKNSFINGYSNSYYKKIVINNITTSQLKALFPLCFNSNPNCQLNINRKDGIAGLVIDGSLTVDEDICIANFAMYFNPNAKLIVQSGKELKLVGCRLAACTSAWESVEVQDLAQIFLSNTEIDGAHYGIYRIGGGFTWIQDNSKIANCSYGIFTDGSGNPSIKLERSKLSDISNIGLYIAGSVAKTLVNRCEFVGMNCGVACINSELEMYDNAFNDIGTNVGVLPTSFQFPYENNAIYFNGMGAKKIKSYQANAPTNISNTNGSVVIDNGNFELSKLNVSDASFGVVIVNSPTTNNTISDCILKTNNYGIYSNLNGALSFNASNNEVEISSVSGSGIYVGANNGLVDIKKNSITNVTGLAGIRLSGSSNATIQNNDILVQNSNGTRSTGIFIENSDDNMVKCNVINSAAFGAGTTAMEIRESINGSYLCNDMTGADCGLVFAGMCNPSTTGENTLSTHPVVGLVVSTPQNGSDGIIGPQTHRGNHLTGCSSNADAWNYGAFNVVIQSKFLVSPNLPYLPNNISNLVNLGFFSQPENGKEFSCNISGACPNGIGRSKLSVMEENNLSQFLIEQDLGIDTFNDARTWSSRLKVLEFILQRELSNKYAQQWIKKYRGTAIFLFAEMNNFLSGSMKYPKERRYEYSKYLLDELNKFKFTSVFEINQQVVSGIRLKLMNEERGINLNELIKLKAIAESCPYSGGNSVYEARMLLEGITRLDINEDISCGLRINKSIQDPESMDETVEVYPNPAVNYLNIQINHRKKGHEYRVQLYNLNGVMLTEQNITHTKSIDLNNIPSGIYNLRVNCSNTKIIKVCIIR